MLDGSFYGEEFYNNLMHGEGTSIWDDDNFYLGHFVNNLRNGYF